MGTASDIPKQFAAALGEGEQALAFARARLPRVGTRRTTFIAVHLVVEAVDAVRNRRALRRARAIGTMTGFPLDRRMALVITAERLVIFRAPRVGAVEKLGEVPRSRIVSASMPYLGGGWRTVMIRTSDGLIVRLQVDRERADTFVNALSDERDGPSRAASPT